ncbi:hypothetical protein [Flagellimonas okinawensis]|uniref:Integrase catalytic domain-containing protein n=1 Tax=Flagellimonas okinawensis TaxID=3031324 RepID=A0ABT5XPA1_9FLAO|nr:hypothetical protein [[Muricauda] okinawensis]MDF0707723.1 hypothetical protein [[Muricauda] okinawensis]
METLVWHTERTLVAMLLRSVKYEKIYLNPPSDRIEPFLSLAVYFDSFNHERRHQFIDYKRPIDLFKRAAYNQGV